MGAPRLTQIKLSRSSDSHALYIPILSCASADRDNASESREIALSVYCHSDGEAVDAVLVVDFLPRAIVAQYVREPSLFFSRELLFARMCARACVYKSEPVSHVHFAAVVFLFVAETERWL